MFSYSITLFSVLKQFDEYIFYHIVEFYRITIIIKFFLHQDCDKPFHKMPNISCTFNVILFQIGDKKLNKKQILSVTIMEKPKMILL